MNVINFARKSIEAIRRSRLGFNLRFYQREGIKPKTDNKTLVSKYSGWVYACCNLSGEGVAATPLRLYRARAQGEGRLKLWDTMPVEKERVDFLRTKSSLCYNARIKAAVEIEEVVDYPALTVLKNINQGENQYETFSLTEVCKRLTGDVYWYFEKAMAVPVGMYVLRPQYMKVVPDVKQGVKGYIYQPRGPESKVALDAADVIHYKNKPNPVAPWYGWSDVAAGVMAVTRQEEMDLTDISLLQRQGVPDLFLKYKSGVLSRMRRQELRNEWNALFAGSRNAGGTYIADEDFDVTPIGMSPKEMQFLQGRPWTLAEIAGMFPVPVAMLDTTNIKKAPGAGIETTQQQMATYNTLPSTKKMEQKMNEELLPMFPGGERLFFAFDDPRPANKQFLMEQEKQDLEMYVTTVNKVREKRGLDPVPWGDTPIAPLTVAPLGSATTTPGIEDNAAKAMIDYIEKHFAANGADGSSGGDFFDGEQIHRDLKGVLIHAGRD